MRNLVAVHVHDCLAELPHDIDRLFLADFILVIFDIFIERASHELHGAVDVCFVLQKLKDANNVWMARCLENADLVLKQIEETPVTLLEELDFVDDFNGALYARASVLACTDCAEITLSKLLADHVLIRDVFRLS